MYDDKNRHTDYPHSVVLEDRTRLSISGVDDVASFDETTVVLYTNRGLLTIRGQSLRVDRLSIDGGELSIEGSVDSLEYQDEQAVKDGGFWSRLFR